MNETEHSPLPWVVTDHLDDVKTSMVFINACVDSEDAITVAEVHYYHSFRRDEKPPLEEVRANAALIVAAVNPHAATQCLITRLTEALEHLLDGELDARSDAMALLREVATTRERAS